MIGRQLKVVGTFSVQFVTPFVLTKNDWTEVKGIRNIQGLIRNAVCFDKMIGRQLKVVGTFRV